MKIYTEITPLSQNDVFVILNSEKIGFDYPIHSHPEFELTLVMNSFGNRIIGDSVQKYQQEDLVLIGSEVYHKWDDDDVPQNQKNSAHVITIQFPKNLFDQSLFMKDSFYPIRTLLKDSQRGIKYTGETFKAVAQKMKNLANIKKGFGAVIEFLKILDMLSVCKEKRYLASEGFISIKEDDREDKINKMYKYLLDNYNDCTLRVTELANEFNMSPSAFGHFFKKCTNKSFTQFVIDLRLGYASRLLLNSNDSIAEIAYKSGFNNIANFNRLFKKNKFVTPKEYRANLVPLNNFDLEKQLTPNQFVPSTRKSEVL